MASTETDILIDLVEKNYSFLTAGFNPTKTKAMVDKKWDEITQSILKFSRKRF